MAQNENNVSTYEIVIRAKRIKGEKDGRKYDFLAYEAYDNDGRKCKIRFTKDVKNLPTDAGEYTFVIPKNKMNRDKSIKWREYWVQEVLSCTAYEPKFDGTVEELPF